MSVLFTNLRIIMGKHKLATFLLIVFSALCLCVFGTLSEKADRAHASSEKYDETYGNKTYYRTVEAINDNAYHDYCTIDSKGLYEKLLSFEQLLLNSEAFTFIDISVQPVDINMPELAEQFFYGYENGRPAKPYRVDGRILQPIKSLQVSKSFFDEYDISVSDGEGFSEEDYFHKNKENIPVLLGSEYKEFFATGDKLYGDYLSERFTFIVKGFISEDAFFPDQSTMTSCGRYIVMPALFFETKGDAAKYSLLQKLCGIVSSSMGYEKTKELFEQYKLEANVANRELYISDPNAFADLTNFLDQYSAMTKEVASQFTVMVLIVMLFGVIATTLTLCSALRKNRQNFGIEMLCGATRVDIFKVALLFLLTVLLTADALSLLFAPDAMLSIQLAVLCMLLLSSIITAVYIKNMDMHDILGGNE
ncbi:MAG: hypothetical protein II871_05665 [Clostridia bacterium]|nr:hypothetical protein [Clostridia bacterium]